MCSTELLGISASCTSWGPRWSPARRRAHDTGAYMRALDTIVNLFETRRKELTTGNLTQTLLDELRNLRSEKLTGLLPDMRPRESA